MNRRSRTDRRVYSAYGVPRPISATSVSPTGGTSTIVGLNFMSGVTASVNILGLIVALTVTFVSSTQLSAVLPVGVYSTGLFPVTFTNPNGRSTTVAGLITIA